LLEEQEDLRFCAFNAAIKGEDALEQLLAVVTGGIVEKENTGGGLRADGLGLSIQVLG
jgi:hypothetical protein